MTVCVPQSNLDVSNSLPASQYNEATETVVSYMEAHASTMQDYATRDVLLRIAAAFVARTIAAAQAAQRQTQVPTDDTNLAMRLAALHRVRAVQLRLDASRRRTTAATGAISAAAIALASASPAAARSQLADDITDAPPAPAGPEAEQWVLSLAERVSGAGASSQALFALRSGLAAAGVSAPASALSALLLTAVRRVTFALLCRGDAVGAARVLHSAGIDVAAHFTALLERTVRRSVRRAIAEYLQSQGTVRLRPLYLCAR